MSPLPAITKNNFRSKELRKETWENIPHAFARNTGFSEDAIEHLPNARPVNVKIALHFVRPQARSPRSQNHWEILLCYAIAPSSTTLDKLKSNKN